MLVVKTLSYMALLVPFSQYQLLYHMYGIYLEVFIFSANKDNRVR